MINGPFLRRTVGGQAPRVLLVALALGVWGFLMPVVYATFGREFEVILESGIIPEAFLRLLGSDPLSLAGAVSLGAVHPIAIALQCVFPVGFAAAAIAGERQRGTLEVLLSRPLSRRSVVTTLATAVVAFAVVTVAGFVAGTVVGAVAFDVADRLDPSDLAFLALNLALLLAALGAVSLAASATFDRLAPALGVAFAFVLVSYVLEFLGTLWPDAEPLQPLSVFHYLQPLDILAGERSLTDLAVLAVVAVAALAHVLFWFPRRDIPAPA